MVLSELEKLLSYINLCHSQERSSPLYEPLPGYTRKVVVSIDCKMALHKNCLPVGRCSVITIRTDAGEEKSFDVSGINWCHDSRLQEIKWWLIGTEPGDWYGLTFIDSKRRGKFVKQVMSFRMMRPDFKADVMAFAKDFLNGMSSDPFYMSDDEMYRELERLMR